VAHLVIAQEDLAMKEETAECQSNLLFLLSDSKVLFEAS
jgi:hypothetical protein